MSMISKLDVFKLNIREKGNRDEFTKFNDIAGFNLLDEVYKYLGKNIYLFKIDNETERTSRIEKNELDGNDLYCRIKIGKFGETSEIVDTLSGSGVFKKEKEHSDTIPLFFHMHINSDFSKCIVNIQRVGNRTLMPEIKNILNRVLMDLRDDRFIYELKPLRENITITNFIKKKRGQLSAINIILKDSIENDYMDRSILTLKAKYRKSFPKEIIEKVSQCAKTKDLQILKTLMPQQLENLELSSALLEFKLNDRPKIKVDIFSDISLQNSIKLSNKTDNTDKSGHMSFNYLKNVSKENIK